MIALLGAPEVKDYTGQEKSCVMFQTDMPVIKGNQGQARVEW